ncbi:MAG: heme-binding Shp domain-containing protein [Hydrogeniiclostridium mannosilyticum]
MLALMAGITAIPAFAASNGIYTATATSHYKHPTTGKIEDSGGEGSYVLGQSMTDSALNKAALVEVDPQGNTYVTIRLNLMDNIQNPNFQVDASRSGSFSAVSATVMQEDYSNNTTDFRMKVPSENAVIRCNMYVVPMGREVIFYITVGNLQSGSGDFVTSVTVEQPAQEPAPEPNTPAQTTPQTPSNQQPRAGSSSSKAPSSQPESSAAPSSSEASSSEPSSSEEASSSVSSNESSSSTAGGLMEFDESGNAVNNSSSEAEESNSGGNPIIWWVIGGIVVVAIAGGCVWYFCFFKKKK